MRAAEGQRSIARPATLGGLSVAVAAAFLILISHARSQPAAEGFRHRSPPAAAASTTTADGADDLNAEMEARLAADVKHRR